MVTLSELSRDEVLARLRAARAELRAIRSGVDEPAIYQSLKMAEMNLHWAGWLLADVDEILPELEEFEA